jgi:hypothetical protein
MGNRQARQLIMDLEGNEMAVVRTAIAAGLTEMERTQRTSGDDYERLLDLQRAAKAVASHGPYRLPMDRAQAEALRAYVAMIMAMQGYVVGRPAAIVALANVTTKLQRLLKGSRWDEMRQAAGEILYGVFLHDSARMFRKNESNLEHLFVLINFGDLIGIPILPPYYTLRLLPFVVPLINGWRRRMLREKDLLDAIF